MREIKFRGKTAIDFENGRGDVIKKKSEWIYGGISMDVNRVWIDMPYYGQIIVDKETVGQYTGLKDKNGKEIYEGDIIEWTTISGKKYRFSVEYSNKYAQYIVVNTGDASMEYEPLGDYENIEVIGNVWENSDLLKGE